MAQVPAVEALGLEAVPEIVRAEIVELQWRRGSPEMLSTDGGGIQYAASARLQQAAAVELGQIADDGIDRWRRQDQKICCTPWSVVLGEQLDWAEPLNSRLELFDNVADPWRHDPRAHGPAEDVREPSPSRTSDPQPLGNGCCAFWGHGAGTDQLPLVVHRNVGVEVLGDGATVAVGAVDDVGHGSFVLGGHVWNFVCVHAFDRYQGAGSGAAQGFVVPSG